MSSDVSIPSHSSVLAQVNDVYVNEHFKKCFGKCAVRTKILGNVSATYNKASEDRPNRLTKEAIKKDKVVKNAMVMLNFFLKENTTITS